MSGFEGPLYVALRPSVRLARVLLVAYPAAAAAVAVLFPMSPEQFALIAAIALSAAFSLRAFRRRLPGDVRAVLLTGDDGWQLSLRDGRQVRGTLAAAPFVTRHLVVLPLALDDGSVKRVVLAADSADPDALRRLRVRLRFGSRRAVTA